MFRIEIKNPCAETVQYIQEETLFDFEMIELKFKKSFYGDYGYRTDRNKMKIGELEIEYKDWMDTHLTMENGLIEFIVPKGGRYEIVQKSRSSNWDKGDLSGPAMGVTIEFQSYFTRVNISYAE